MQPPDLTLVIPAYNEKASLRQFLPELLNFCGQQGIIIADGCSADGTGAVRSALRPNL